MTAVATKGRESYLPTLQETSTYQVIDLLSQPTRVDVGDTLVYLWAGSTPQHAEEGYPQQARILAAILGRHVNPLVVVDAMEACGAIHRIQTGDCLTSMYGVANTDQERDRWLDYEQQNLTFAAMQLGGGVAL